MIGASLVGASGILNWGGGSNGCQARPTSGIFQLCPTVGSPHALPYVLHTSTRDDNDTRTDGALHSSSVSGSSLS